MSAARSTKPVDPRAALDRAIERLARESYLSAVYEPGNVRWATAREQALNRRSNRMVTIGTETLPVGAWLDRYDTSRELFNGRVRAGWSVVDAITRPVEACKSHPRSVSSAAPVCGPHTPSTVSPRAA